MEPYSRVRWAVNQSPHVQILRRLISLCNRAYKPRIMGDENESEDCSRIRRGSARRTSLRVRDEDDSCGSSFRNGSTRGRISTRSCIETSQTWAQEEDHAFRFPRPCRRRLELGRKAILSSQGFVSQSFADNLRDCQLEATTVVHSLSVIVAESLLIDVAEQVVWLDTYISAMQPALQETPEVLDSIGVNVTADVFDGVVDDRVIVVFIQPVIRGQLIGEDYGASFNVLADSVLEFLSPTAIEMQGAHPAVTFYHSEHDGLIHPAGAVNFLRALDAMHVAGFAADHAFVNFDVSAKLAATLVLHCESDTMEHEPRGFLSDAKRAMEFPRANSILVIDDHPDGGEPLVQSERGILEDSSSLQAEFRAVVFAVALPDARLVEIDDVIGLASRTANNAIRPAKIDHEFAAVFIVLKVDNGFAECVAKFHKSEISNSRLVCQVYSCRN
jgi:hypothetical protein